MRVLRIFAVALFIIAGAIPAFPLTARAGTAEAGRVIVGFDATASGPRVRAAHAAADAHVVDRLPAIDIHVVDVENVTQAMAAYETMPGVKFVEPDGIVHALDAPDDPLYSQLQWHLQAVSAQNRGTANWESIYKPGAEAELGKGVRVAIIDSGLRTSGEVEGDEARDTPLNVNWDLARDYVDDGDDEKADDDNGHGTHIAGTIAQATSNGEGVAGVAPAAEIVPIKALSGETGNISAIVSAVTYAAEIDAQVINLSLGGQHFSEALCTSVKAAARRALVISASGNESQNSIKAVTYPAACPGVISVGALRYDGSRAAYSNAGCQLSLVAPGGDMAQDNFNRDGNPDGIWQETFVRHDPPSAPPGQPALPPRYDFDTYGGHGTSMASAHVSGAAAILLAKNPDIPAARRLLKASARDLGPGGPDDTFGHGALDIAAAVAAQEGPPPVAPDRGYWMVAADGGIFNFGTCFQGSTGNLVLRQPVVGMTATPTGDGYWLVARDGGIFSFGDAAFFGSTGALRLNKPIVAMESTPSGDGYWLVASDGGIFAFGDAPFFGSTGAVALNQPIVTMAATPSGHGYWLVASDGGIFAFGDAPFFGSTGGLRLNQPIVTAAATPSGGGYWLTAADGGIFSFGNAAFYGSTGSLRLSKPIVAMAPTATAGGYWLVGSDGGVFSFGNAPFKGSTGAIALNQPIVGMAVGRDG